MWWIWLLLGSWIGIAQAGELRELQVLTEAWPPYVFEENGEVHGVDYEVCEAVLAKMGYALKLQFVPWNRALALTKAGKADAILDADKGKRSERTDWLYFPEPALSSSSSHLFSTQARTVKYQGIQSLVGLNVGLMRGYHYSAAISDDTRFTRDYAANHEQNLNKLIAGRVDVVIINRIVGRYTAQQMGILDSLYIDPTPVSRAELFLAFSKSRGHTLLAAQFGKELAQFKHTAVYRAILARYGQ